MVDGELAAVDTVARVLDVVNDGSIDPAKLLERKRKIQHLLDKVMVEGVHYMVIPGCKKPSLLQEGAEMLLNTFVLGNKIHIEDLGTSDEARYRVRVEIIHLPTGMFVAEHVGACSSHEEKYMWRKAICDEEYDETDEDRKRNVWKKDYGKITKIRQIRTEKASQENTVLKMAVKRALVSGARLATGCSDMFAVDIDDMEHPPEEEKPTRPKPQRKSTAKVKAEATGSDSDGKPTGNGDADPSLISEPQRKRLFAIYKNNGWDDKQAKAYIKAMFGYDSSKDIKKGHDYEAICLWLEAHGPEVEWDTGDEIAF